MNRRGDEFGELLDVIARATRFMRHYLGEVLDNQDPLARGRVRVAVHELGWSVPTAAPWADPEYGPSVSIPAVGSFVVVYFMAGDPSRPMYRGRSGEVAGQSPSPMAGPKDVTVLDEPFGDGRVTVTYDRESGELRVSGAALVALNGDSKAMVTHAELDAALQGLVSALNGHVHPVAAVGSPTGVPASVLTLDVSEAATTTIKTGG